MYHGGKSRLVNSFFRTQVRMLLPDGGSSCYRSVVSIAWQQPNIGRHRWNGSVDIPLCIKYWI